MIRDKSVGARAFDILNAVFMVAIMAAMLYPILYVVFASFSNPALVRTRGGVLLWPLEPTLTGYQIIFGGSDVWTGYKNSLIYVVAGTAVNIAMTSMGAFVLSRRNLMLKKAIMFMIVFTMYFSGGLIPFYFVVRDLGMIDSRLAMIIPSALSTWNLIIMRTSFMALPEELEQSAKIDGANDIVILLRIILPVSTPIIAVMILFYGVGHWNSWFNAAIFLKDRSLFPLQLFLREILILGDMVTDSSRPITRNAMDSMQAKMIVKYSTTVVATLPVLMIYPFLQKYFIKGIMIGSLKE